MATEYQLRVTIAVPEAHMTDANQLALVLGESPADDQTFTTTNWKDTEGNLYSVCSTVAKPTLTVRIEQPLMAPIHAPDADLEAATRAQQILSVGSLQSPVTASPGHIAVILGDRLENTMNHVSVLGLSLVENHEWTDK